MFATSYKRIAGRGSNAAHVVFVPCNLYVAVVAPFLTPAVLYQPVCRAGCFVDTVANSKNAMVQVFGAAFFVPVDTLAVELERLMTGINCHAARALNIGSQIHAGEQKSCSNLGGDGSFQSILIARLDINEANVPSPLVPWVVSALVILSLIGIRLLSVDATVVLDVLESSVHEATVTSLVPVFAAAVNKVLLRKAKEAASEHKSNNLQTVT